jgi:hypothetical protein
MVNKRDADVFIVCLSCYFDVGLFYVIGHGGTPLAFLMIRIYLQWQELAWDTKAEFFLASGSASRWRTAEAQKKSLTWTALIWTEKLASRVIAETARRPFPELLLETTETVYSFGPLFSSIYMACHSTKRINFCFSRKRETRERTASHLIDHPRVHRPADMDR